MRRTPRPGLRPEAERLDARLVPSSAVTRGVLYRDLPGDRQALDVYRPSGPVPDGGRPVIVAIHGGGWFRFGRRQFGPVVAPLTRKGFVVVAPDYRLSAPGRPSWPTNVEDVRAAVRWVRDHAAGLGVNPTRIAAMGESAGGHLAELVGTDPGETSDAATSARVQAVVSFYGPSDLSALAARSPAAAGRVRMFLGTSPAQDPALYRAASPIVHVSPDDPPILLVHGSADTLVPPSQSKSLYRTLRRAEVASRLVIVPGAPHGFGLAEGGRNLGGMVARFLRRAMP